ncbi:MAG: hypothetical protein H6713_12020 [Myxococcales bacterium]|nr:hypothetical protein [Myxococcales bacterium]
MRISAATLGTLALAGCSSPDDFRPTGDTDTGGNSQNGATDESPGTSAATSGGPGASDTDAVTATAYETDGSGTTSGTAGQAETTDASGLAPCQCDPPVSCGAGFCHAACADEEEFPAECVCEAGVIDTPATYGCHACEPVVGGTHNIDLAVQSVNGRIFINESNDPPPIDLQSSAKLYLLDPGSGDTVVGGLTNELAFDTKAISGVYDVAYSIVNNSEDALPWNSRAAIERVAVTEFRDEPDVRDVYVSSTFLGGKFTLNVDGQAGVEPGDGGDDGNIYLRDRVTGDSVLLGSTHDKSYTGRRVLAGEYDVVFELESPGSLMPRNHVVVLPESAEVTAKDVTAELLDVEIPVVEISGTFLLNGGPAPGEVSDHGLVMLRDPVTQDVFELGRTSDGTYKLRVVPGVYDVLYTGLASTGEMPMNAGAVIGQIKVGAGELVNDINIAATKVSGAITIDGATPPELASDDGELWLEGSELGRVRLGNTSDLTYDASVIDGVYDVYYTQQTASELAPVNTHARLSADVTLPDGLGSIDISTTVVSGVFLLDGAEPALPGLEDARVYLKDELTGDSVLLGYLSEGDFSRRVVKGDYQVYYSLEAGGGLLPVNLNGRTGQSVSATEELFDDGHELDVRPVQLTGSLLFNGGPPPTDANDYGLYYLVHRDTGDEIYLGSSVDQQYSVNVLPGEYLIYYRHGYTAATKNESPRNSNALVGCVELMNP